LYYAQYFRGLDQKVGHIVCTIALSIASVVKHRPQEPRTFTNADILISLLLLRDY
jgi:hypothetical protein